LVVVCAGFGHVLFVYLGCFLDTQPPYTAESVKAPNDLKLSDRGVRRGTCMAGGKAAAEAGAVTHGAVRCSPWLN